MPTHPGVVITGVGLVTALGGDRESSWRGLCAGAHGGRALGLPGAPAFAGFPAAFEPHSAKALLAASAREAFDDAGLDGAYDPERVAVVAGLSKGDLGLLGRLHGRFLAGGADAIDGRWTDAWPSTAADAVAGRHDLRGPRLAPVAACATGLIAAIQAADLIRRGVCDAALAGAGDASLDPFVLHAFRRMGVLARWDDAGGPGRAVRPWDRKRSGFLVGEGAAVVALERADRAEARGALPYCGFAGGAFGGDAYHLTDLDPDPSNLASVIGRALAAAGVDPSEIDHVNVHATATRSNDPVECGALRLALGRWAGGASCSANKAQVGHCLGAAGAVELGFTALAVRDQFAPPTLNLDDPDPACDLDATPHAGRARPIRGALKLSLGFGGHLAAAVLTRPEGPRRAPGGPS